MWTQVRTSGTPQGGIQSSCPSCLSVTSDERVVTVLACAYFAGRLLLAQFSHDKCWYRARVMNIIEPDESETEGEVLYDVFFIDFGNTETVTIQK